MTKSTTTSTENTTKTISHNKSNRKWKSKRVPVSRLASKPFSKSAHEEIKSHHRSQKDLLKRLQKQVNEKLQKKRQEEIRAVRQRRQAKQEKLWKEQQFERLKQSTQKSNGRNKRVTGRDHKLAKAYNEIGKIVV